jgi:enoyl-[acyl-carrier protein] reductase III
LAPKGISVNAVSGGYVETDALKHFNAASEMLRAGSMNPVGRMVTGSDIAQTVAFLCSQEAEMIRGQVVVVDGGYTLTH